MEDQNTDTLHEQASDHYLNGRFNEALHAWRQLLTVDPADKRAQEGARLAGMMASSADPPPPAAPAVEPVAEAPLELGELFSAVDPDSPVPELELDLGLQVDAAEPAAPSSALPDPNRQSEGIDFGDMSQVEAIALGGDVPTDEPRRGLDGIAEQVEQPAPAAELSSAEAAIEAVLDSLSLDGGTAETAPAPPPETPVEVEAEAGDPNVEGQLTHRVEQLIAEARQAADAGNREEALSILARVAILDEQNETAGALEQQLRNSMAADHDQIELWISEGVQLLQDEDCEQALARFQTVLERSPEHREAQGYVEQIQQRMQQPGSGPAVAPSIDEPLGDFDLDIPDLPVEQPADTGARAMDAEPGLEAVPLANTEQATVAASPDFADADLALPLDTPRPAAPAKPKASKTIGKPVLLTVALLIVIGVVALWALPKFLIDNGLEPATPQGTVKSAPTIMDELQIDAAGQPEQAGDGMSAQEKATRVASAMQRAQDANARGNHSAAILAFNEVLSIDANNLSARRGLMTAGESYKAEQQQQEQVKIARGAFEDGDYTNALRLLYRVPEEALSVEERDRFIVNGWYNLAVVSLRAGDIPRAKGHLEELLAMREGDTAAQDMQQLAEAYDGATKDAVYYTSVEALRFRKLDD